MYCKHAKHQEGGSRHQEQELKATSDEISQLKAGNVSSIFTKQEYSENWKTKIFQIQMS
jgi:hypothetical protein